MSIDRYTKFISEQVRKSTVAGLRSQAVVEEQALEEATEKTAVKNELKKLNQHLGSEVEGSQRTGRGSQTTSPRIDTSHHSKDKVAKVLQNAGYKKIASHKSTRGLTPDHDSYEKTDEHGYKHHINHAFTGDNNHSIHHVGASKVS